MLSGQRQLYSFHLRIFEMLKKDQNFLIYFKPLKQFYNLDAPTAMFSTIIEHLMSADEQYFVVNSNQHLICTLTSCKLTFTYTMSYFHLFILKRKRKLCFFCKLVN